MPGLPMIGARIRYTTRTATTGCLQTVERVGVVRVVWTNGWDGAHIETDTGCCIPSLGDTWTELPKGQP
jgi:hypothetical protein